MRFSTSSTYNNMGGGFEIQRADKVLNSIRAAKY